ncbi:MAG: hypothetical protein HN392_03800 [Anaerolineae bacterium]|jgi:hypothetical protein|nr:hypothetical protein [Anaerolineae bacterium]MBT7075053.1 hypothetical protein [Anaerolineae bacterium]MBT7781898.1 hypothetical protein [Anaerolineae bacterium]
MPNLDDGIHASHPTVMPVWENVREIRASKPLAQHQSAIQEDRSGSRFLIIALALGILFLCTLSFFSTTH